MLIRLLKIIARRRGALGCTSSIVILIAAVLITVGLLRCGGYDDDKEGAIPGSRAQLAAAEARSSTK